MEIISMMTPKNNKKSLEETIAELHKKYQNKVSPLSEEYKRSNSSVNYIPQKPSIPTSDHRQNILDGFRPNSRYFGMPMD